jgi:chromosome partitioning protein
LPRLCIIPPKSRPKTGELILDVIRSHPHGITVKQLSQELNRPVSMLHICLKSLQSSRHVYAKLSENGMQLIYYPKNNTIKNTLTQRPESVNLSPVAQKSMFIAIVSLKGGVGKTTTAIHLATYFQELEPTLLIDADRNRSALVWAKEEKLPFYVASQAGAPALVKRFTHIITDMKARPEEDELKDLAKGNDLLIIPTTPNHLDLDATVKAIETLKPLGINYKILLTKVDARTKNGKFAEKFLQEHKLPLFKAQIPLLVAFERASQHGVTVKDYQDFRSRQAWAQYQAVGDEIINYQKGNRE